MKNIKLVSVIIAIYEDIEALELILDSLLNQTYESDYEIIVAEDGEDEAVQKYIQSLKYNHIIHTRQKDEGWRKNKSLNNAIKHSNGELLIFLDGDCIPYSDLIENYVLQAEDKTVLCGRRVELGPKYSKRIRNREQSASQLENHYIKHLFSLINDKARHCEEGIKLNDFFFRLRYRNKESHISGCNFALNREDLYSINGFNEDYHWPSVGEDTDIEYRLEKYGCKMKPTRNKTNIYHLYHEMTYSRENNKLAMQYFEKVKKQEKIKCKNGLEKL